MREYVIALLMVQQLLLFGTGIGSVIGGAGRRKLTEEEGGSLNTEHCPAKLKPVLPKVFVLVSDDQSRYHGKNACTYRWLCSCSPVMGVRLKLCGLNGYR